jgi:hypothetical protein
MNDLRTAKTLIPRKQSCSKYAPVNGFICTDIRGLNPIEAFRKNFFFFYNKARERARRLRARAVRERDDDEWRRPWRRTAPDGRIAFAPPHRDASVHHLAATIAIHRPCPPSAAPATSAPGLGSPLPHQHRDWARPCHISLGTSSAPGLDSPHPADGAAAELKPRRGERHRDRRSTQVAGMLRPRTGACATVLRDRIVVCGGWDGVQACRASLASAHLAAAELCTRRSSELREHCAGAAQLRAIQPVAECLAAACSAQHVRLSWSARGNDLPRCCVLPGRRH